MGTNQLVGRHLTHGALAVASRVRLLDALRASERPLDARELAAECGLHVSTVRFHLDVLSEAGLVRSHSESPRTRGRPRLLYGPASVGPPGPETDRISGARHDPRRALGRHPSRASTAGERAGWAVAREQGFTPRPSPSLTAEESVAQVSGLFAEFGFEPELAREGQDLQIRLHACPFRAVAQEHPEVVCSIHLGLLRGALADLGAPATTSSLRPFVEPHLCVAHITPAIESASDAQSPQTPSAANQP